LTDATSVLKALVARMEEN